jgi:hypothetical protein
MFRTQMQPLLSQRSRINTKRGKPQKVSSTSTSLGIHSKSKNSALFLAQYLWQLTSLLRWNGRKMLGAEVHPQNHLLPPQERAATVREGSRRRAEIDALFQRLLQDNVRDSCIVHCLPHAIHA